MKTTFSLSLAFLFCIAIAAQNKTFRVERIVHIKNSPWGNKTDTIVENYIYDNAKLKEVRFVNKNTIEDIHTYEYADKLITVKDKKSRIFRSFQYSPNGQLQELWNDMCDKFTINYTGNNIKSIERYDKCDQYSEGNDFEYADGHLAKVKTFHKKRPENTTDYIFQYENGVLRQIVWGDNIDTYEISRKGNLIENILHTKFGKKDWRKEFLYDKNGNIREENYYTIKDDKETLADKFTITYSNKPGNDDLVWSIYDWKINIFIHQRTYMKFLQMRY